MTIQFQCFPKSHPVSEGALLVVDAFNSVSHEVDSSRHKMASDQVLGLVRPELESRFFEVESGKTADAKIRRPVLFGEGGKPEKTFEADAFHAATGTVLEVEAGRGVTNYQFLKDLFQACVMQDAQHLVIAVRLIYRSSKDYEKVVSFFSTLYASGRLNLPLRSVTALGY